MRITVDPSSRSEAAQLRLARRLGVALALLACALVTACRYPNDPDGTLERITDGTLRAGVTENPPWVIRAGDGADPSGIEPMLLRELARQLNSDIRWHWGSESELIAALDAGQLDVAIGGFQEGAPVKEVVGFTRPYYIAPVAVGSREGAARPPSLAGATVAIVPLTPHIEALRETGARAVETNDLASAALVAAPRWWLQAHGYAAGPQQLGKERYRMAVPPGENGWLLRLQRHLDTQKDLQARVVAAERERATQR